MTTENDGEETGDVEERIEKILAEAEDRITAQERDEEIEDLAGQANELISNTPPNDLLAAIGDPGVEGETLPEAIAESDPRTVLHLRKLLTLSKMARAEDDETRDALREQFRELCNRPEGPGPGEDEMQEQPEADSGAATKGRNADSAEGTDHAERLKEAFQDRLGEFKDGIERTREQLVADSETESDEDNADIERSAPREGTMFSTIPKHRADMNRSGRISTVRPKR